MTVLLQSSSAAVALTLTALHGGAIAMPQAAYLVIGQNLRTTVTALLASIGASIPARRTALAQILFNVFTGLLAFGLTPQLLALIDGLSPALGSSDPAVSIALYHTVFNLLGAAIFLPLTTPFARVVVRLIPDRAPVFTRHLDKSLLQISSVAVEAAARAIGETATALLDQAVNLLEEGTLNHHRREQLSAAQTGIRDSRAFLAQVNLEQHHREEYDRRLTLLHASDHLERLAEACLEREEPLHGVEVLAAARRLAPAIAEAAVWLGQPGWDGVDVVGHLGEASVRQAEERRLHRARLLAQTAAGQVAPDETQLQLEAMRWVDRVGYHSWRALSHLARPGTATDSAA